MTTKISRNAPCPCGSGKKYKRCCLPRAQGSPPKEEAAPSPGPPLVHDEPSDLFESDLDELSNRAVDLIHAGRFDEAEQACRELMEQHPDQVDGLMRFGMLYRARGDKARGVARTVAGDSGDCPHRYLDASVALRYCWTDRTRPDQI